MPVMSAVFFAMVSPPVFSNLVAQDRDVLPCPLRVQWCSVGQTVVETVSKGVRPRKGKGVRPLLKQSLADSVSGRGQKVTERGRAGQGLCTGSGKGGARHGLQR